MSELEIESVERYLRSILGKQVNVIELNSLGHQPGQKVLKGYGYGTPVRVDYETGHHERRTAVLHTLSPGPFGHEEMADRARTLLWEYQAFNRLPSHVRALDVGGFRSDRSLTSLGNVEELFLLTDYAEGGLYAADLERLREDGIFSERDCARADALCDYLLEIHRAKCDNPALYANRIRQLVGHDECIMGLADSYSDNPLMTPRLLEDIEHRCVAWRWRLKKMSHRLRQVHGDFHPWNILFRSDRDFSLLDRSRGEYGEPADDVACLTLNYVFFSLQRTGTLEGCFETLFRRFWERYLDRSGDREILQAIAPFYTFRALVMASPIWYPALPDEVRSKLAAFMLAVLDEPSFDPGRVNTYCGA